jgi:predicted CXXCH cytochrome family protein
MECASCHDVHNTKNTGDTFTWVQDTNSNLCLSCHKK